LSTGPTAETASLPRLARKSYFGHATELDAVEQALVSSRAVLLLGPGGAGKTRIALAVASRHASPVFCDFSAARTGGEAIRAMANVLGITLAGGSREAGATQVRHALEARPRSLLVLDNLETVRGAEDLLASWTGSGPTFLGTSRTRSSLPHAAEVALGPLDVTEAVALFADRARALDPDFQPDAATEQLVVRLGGNPLAIELAAARSHVLSPRELLERFSRHLDLVKSASAAVPDRHRSLRAVIAGSWDLCPPADQRALAAASVFVGGFDAPAAEAVIGADAADRLESLLASSLLVRRSLSTGETRFTLSDTVRELARERLAEDAALEAEAMHRHAEHFRTIAITMRERTTNADPEALRLIEIDGDNLLAAFRFDGRAALSFHPIITRNLPADLEIELIEQARPAVAASPIDAAEVELTLTRAYRRYGRAERNLEQARAAMRIAEDLGHDELIVEAGYMLTNTLSDSGRRDEAIACAEQAVEIGERCGAFGLVARTLGHLAFALADRGDHVRASQHAERILAIGRQRAFLLLESFGENLLGMISGKRGDLDAAARHLERSVELARQTRHRSQEAVALGNLGKAYMLRGDLDDAYRTIEETWRLTRLEGNRFVEVPQLTNLALLDFERGRLADARARAAQAELLAREVEHRRQIIASTLLLGEISLEEARLDEARADFGRALEVAEALQFPAGEALANAGLAAAIALSGLGEQALERIELAAKRAPESDWETRSIIEARRAIVLVAAGDGAEAVAQRGQARTIVEAARARAGASIELRIALRLADAVLAERGNPRGGLLEVVTREGVCPAEAFASDVDLAFDARTRSLLVDGRLVADLRKKPLVARLIEVVLGHPTEALDKERLYQEVWRSTLRNMSQAAAIYKAVDRLSKLLDDDPRRFLRWDEAGALVLVARSPALLRLPQPPSDA